MSVDVGPGLQPADAASVRGRIATVWMGADAVPDRIGRVVLRAHQRDAAARLRRAIRRYGGALLADDVGLGKTYTAIAAVAPEARLVVVAPAALRAMWRQALADCDRTATLLSFEALSRGGAAARALDARALDTAIVDEAHHARNPATHRYARLAALTRWSRVLLLSATPVHNDVADLHALLALFLGSRASRMTTTDLAACVVRRRHVDIPAPTTPGRAPPEWCELRVPQASLDAVLEAVLAIPPAGVARDGAPADALITLGLVHAWSSTDAALRAALEHRLARAESLRDALVAERHPTRRELTAWVVGTDATQLAFPELVASSALDHRGTGLLDTVTRHAAGVRYALRVLAVSDGLADDARRDVLREIRRRHSGVPVVAFSQFAESAVALYRRLCGDGRVALVTARGARVAGGAISRDDAIRRFAPLSAGELMTRAPPPAEAIDLLVATDLLSEGLNLHDAGVVIHVDLPWTAARLAQRLGRVWRMGSPHERVFEYALAPPRPADRTLRLLARLEAKAAATLGTVGGALAPLLRDLPAGHGAIGWARPIEDVDPLATEPLRRALLAWSDRAAAPTGGHPRPDPDGAPAALPRPVSLVGAARSDMDGWLAALSIAGEPCLLAAVGDSAATTDPGVLLRIATATTAHDVPIAPPRLAAATAAVDAFTAARRADAAAAIDDVGSGPRARVAARIAHIAAAAPAHRRAHVARLSARARDALAGARSAGAERVVASLLTESTGQASNPGAADACERWLERIPVALSPGRGACRPPAPGEVGPGSPGGDPPEWRLEALLLLVGEDREIPPG